MKYNKIYLFLLTAALFLSGGMASVAAQDYWQVVTPERYKRMSQFERVQYEKAMQLLRDRQYRAAANEFDRFLVQYKESEVIPYMKFLQAYALHNAKDRNKAIGVYNEVLDFFGGEIDAAAPAMYYRGMAQFDNGDYSKGMTTMKELLDDPDYKKHPVAASASLQLVRNYWKNKEPQKAETYLKRIFAEHRGSKAAENAKYYYMASCACTGKMADFTAWYLSAYREDAEKKKIKASQLHVNMVNDMCYLLMNWGMYHTYFVNDDMVLKYRGGTKGPDPFKELWQLLQDQEMFYKKADMMWDYYYNAVKLLSAKRIVKDPQFDKLVSDAVELVAKTPDDEKNKDRQQKRFGTLVDMLYDSKRWEHGAYVNTRIKDEKVRLWNEYRSLEGQRKWDDALKQLETVSNKFAADPKMVSKAGWAKAWILRVCKHEYDEAIKAYRAVGEPPNTLWEIAECQKAKKDSKAAIQTYIEIENSFPDSGPEAAWRRANYYKQLGENKKAIAEARRLLRVYPKKAQASWAHQFLEGMGVEDTGLGAGVDDDF